MRNYREVTISRENLKSKKYIPDEVVFVEFRDDESEDFYLPAIELLYEINKNEGGNEECKN